MSFFGSLFGSDQQRYLSDAKAAADKNLDSGYTDAKNAYTQYGNEAKGYYQPYVQNGQKANQLYSDAMGLNGAQGGQNALSAYQGARNPFQDWQQNYTQQGMDHAANARGMLNSGTNALAVARARQQMGYNDYNNWLSGLQGMNNQGMQAAGGMSSVAMNQGNQLGNLGWGYGTTKAGNEINYGNALSQNATSGVNNLIGLGGTLIKSMSGMPSIPGLNPGMGNF